MRPSLLCLWCLAAPALAAEVCPPPERRETLPLQEAAQQDEMLAVALERVADACEAGSSAACEEAVVKCEKLASFDAERPLRHEEMRFRVDLEGRWNGQAYALERALKPYVAHGTVACRDVPAEVARATAAERRQGAARHQHLADEYERWFRWAGERYRQCHAEQLAAVEALRAREQQAQLEAQERAAAAAAAAQREAEERAAREEAARKAKAEQEEKARRLEAERAAQEEAARKAKEEAARKAKAERAAQEEAARKAKEEAARKARGEREEQARRLEAEKRAQEEARRQAAGREARAHAEAEELRRQQERAALEKAKLAEEARYQQTVQRVKDEERREKELAEAQRKKEEVDQELIRRQREETLARAEQERKARLAALEPPSRSRGTVHLGGAFGLFSRDGQMDFAGMATLVGGTAGVRHTFWFGGANVFGLELGAQALYLTELASATHLTALDVSGGLRLWVGPVGLGAVADCRWMAADDALPLSATPTLAAGPTLAFALVDNRTARVLLGGRWLPLLSGTAGAWAAGLEVGYGVLHFTLEAGTLRDSAASLPAQLYGAATLGVRGGW